MTGAGDIRAFGDDVRRFAEAAPGDLIALVDDEIKRQLARDTGGDGALSHGRKLGRATTTVSTRNGEAEVTASGSRNVWGILQGGTSAHVVNAPRGGYLATPYGPRRSVRVSGAPARKTFTEAADRGLDDASRELQSTWSQVGS